MACEMLCDVSRVQLSTAVDPRTVALDDDRELHWGSLCPEPDVPRPGSGRSSPSSGSESVEGLGLAGPASKVSSGAEGVQVGSTARLSGATLGSRSTKPVEIDSVE